MPNWQHWLLDLYWFERKPLKAKIDFPPSFIDINDAILTWKIPFRFSLHENSFYDGIIFVASNFKRMMHVSYLHRFCNILLGWILKALKNWREYTKIFFFKAEKARGLVYQMHKKRIKAFKSRATSMSFLIKRGIPSALFKLNATRATTLWDDVVERTMLVLLYLPYS